MKIASVFKSVTVAFSMYSRIPMPRFRWETEDMRYHLCFFPWVGGVIGILEYLWFLGVARFEIGPTAATLIALSIPILVTGGFHLDGFMDTCDALSSWRTREERLRILSDPHIGAFAVIRLALFGLIYGAALSELTAEGVLFPLSLPQRVHGGYLPESEENRAGPNGIGYRGSKNCGHPSAARRALHRLDDVAVSGGRRHVAGDCPAGNPSLPSLLRH